MAKASAPIVPPVGLFAEGETATQFIPAEGDRYAEARPVREYFVVNPDNGFLNRVGIGSGIGAHIAALVADGDPRVFVSRLAGTDTLWVASSLNIPDTAEGL